jgi:hypothetical protein
MINLNYSKIPQKKSKQISNEAHRSSLESSLVAKEQVATQVQLNQDTQPDQEFNRRALFLRFNARPLDIINQCKQEGIDIT